MGQGLIQGEPREMTLEELADLINQQDGEFVIRIVTGKEEGPENGGGRF